MQALDHRHELILNDLYATVIHDEHTVVDIIHHETIENCQPNAMKGERRAADVMSLEATHFRLVREVTSSSGPRNVQLWNLNSL